MPQSDHASGHTLALDALKGNVTDRIPVGVFTWGFDYYWRAADIEPWKVACGGSETWHKAHMAMYERHKPDIIWYSGAGFGPNEPELIDETSISWFIRENNTGVEYEMVKSSLSLRERDTGKKNCDSVGNIESSEDADRLIPEFEGWGDTYLNGLKRLISEIGDRALVLPHHSPGYICACYAYGFERAMELMLTDPDLFCYACDKFASGDRVRAREWAHAGGEAVFIADGWASCDIISPAMVERFVLPYQKSFAEAAHEAGLRVIMWNEGDVLPILAQEAAIDFDAFAFEQPRKGVDLTVDKVRKVFGKNRCLLGNLDSEELLKRNDPKEIRRAVYDQIQMSGQDAPFILSTGSPIPSDVELEAVDTMISAAREFTWQERQ